MAGDELTALGHSSDEGRAGPKGRTLEAWLAAQGPLATSSALILTRQICADVSALALADLGRTMASLTTANILRQSSGEWRWTPVVSSSLDRRPTDNEIAGRVGAILFECLTAAALTDYLPDAGAMSSRLRDHRPDLPPSIVSLVASLAAARHLERLTIEDVADDIQRAIGLKGARPRKSRALGWVASALVVPAGAALLWASAPGDDRQTGTHGLTRHETALHDLATESADFWALMGEHTVALDRLKELERMWQERVTPDDPRVGLNYLRQGWVRGEAEDFLTAEQMFLTGPGLVGRALGDHHPYVRMARLNLAVALDRRGATDAARDHRQAARVAAARLLPASVASTLEEGGRVPAPGVIAHMAPNEPEREGFRLDDSGGYVAPLTSAARWLAGRDGWRLHVGATDACRVAVDTGADPHRLRVAVRRQDDGWRVVVDGVRPRVDVAAVGSTDGRLAVSVLVTPAGEVSVAVAGVEPLSAVVDPDAVSHPPHQLTFDGTDARQACPLVWWEVAAAR